MSSENGGPAFPQEVRYITPNQQTGSYGPCGGMTLRDYFAAKASDGDIGEIMSRHFYYDRDEYTITRQQARYIHADAMLAARNEPR